jgi:hypothetical protein
MIEACIPKAFGTVEIGVDLQAITAARSALIPTAVGRRSTLRGAPRHELKQVLKIKKGVAAGHALRGVKWKGAGYIPPWSSAFGGSSTLSMT